MLIGLAHCTQSILSAVRRAFGVVLFTQNIWQIAQRLAHFALNEAEVLSHCRSFRKVHYPTPLQVDHLAKSEVLAQSMYTEHLAKIIVLAHCTQSICQNSQSQSTVLYLVKLIVLLLLYVEHWPSAESYHTGRKAFGIASSILYAAHLVHTLSCFYIDLCIQKSSQAQPSVRSLPHIEQLLILAYSSYNICPHCTICNEQFPRYKVFFPTYIIIVCKQQLPKLLNKTSIEHINAQFMENCK